MGQLRLFLGLSGQITLFTSLQNKNTFDILKRGVVNRYGKPNIEDVDEEEIEEVYYGRCKWTKEGALLRNVHSEEGGAVLYSRFTY